MNNKSVSVIGSGAWGTAIANLASLNSKNVLIISQNQLVINDINYCCENKIYLPEIYLSKNVTASDDIWLVDRSDLLFIALPSQYVRSALNHLKAINQDKKIVICSKGIEKDSLMLMSEVANEVLPNCNIAILSGPNLAMEVALNKPTSTTIAAKDLSLAKEVSEIVANEYFKPYLSDDLITNQIAAAAKNIIAIASGLIIGLDLGENARATVITKGISEIADLSVAKGGLKDTIFGFGAIGDILLTCNSTKSRNTSLGIELAKNHSLENILGHRISVAEGVDSAKSVSELAKKLNVSMPICTTINDLLFNNLDLKKAVNNLLL